MDSTRTSERRFRDVLSWDLLETMTVHKYMAQQKKRDRSFWMLSFPSAYVPMFHKTWEEMFTFRCPIWEQRYNPQHYMTYECDIKESKPVTTDEGDEVVESTIKLIGDTLWPKPWPPKNLRPDYFMDSSGYIPPPPPYTTFPDKDHVLRTRESPSMQGNTAIERYYMTFQTTAHDKRYPKTATLTVLARSHARDDLVRWEVCAAGIDMADLCDVEESGSWFMSGFTSHNDVVREDYLLYQCEAIFV